MAMPSCLKGQKMGFLAGFITFPNITDSLTKEEKDYACWTESAVTAFSWVLFPLCSGGAIVTLVSYICEMRKTNSGSSPTSKSKHDNKEVN